MQQKIVLASQSPRRQQLLKQIGYSNFEIRKSDYPEESIKETEPARLVELLALNKARAVLPFYAEKPALIIGGDTVVFAKNKIFGKPRTKKEAAEMLRTISGNAVYGYSGVAVVDSLSGKEVVTHGWGKMIFRRLREKEIERYIQEEKDVLNFAGGFGLLNRGAMLIEGIEGDFFSIVGLPLTKLHLILQGLIKG